MDRKLLGKRIREERLRCKLTQEELSEKVDVTASYIGAVERGEKSMTLEKLIDVVNALGVSVDYILSDMVYASTDNTNERIAALIGGQNARRREMILEIIQVIRRYES